MNGSVTHLSRRISCAVLALMLSGSVLSFAVSADWLPYQEYENVPDYTFFPKARVYYDGLLGDRAYLFNYYFIMPMEGLCKLAGIDVTARAEGDLHTLSGENFDVRFLEHSRYIRINGRYYYSDEAFNCINGHICIPISMLEQIFHVTAEVRNGSIYFDTSSISVAKNNPNYYTENYGEETIYWLSHIIDAEGYREGLEGRMGIGNVVLNRVSNKDYPDNIHDVIFDTHGGVQFSVTLEGGLESEPVELSLVAACLCLEGYNNVGDSLFFVCPYECDTSWFDNYLIQFKSIDNLTFYSLPEEE